MKIFILSLLLLTSCATKPIFNVGECIKIKRKDPSAGVVFVVDEVKEEGFAIRGNFFILDRSALDNKHITHKQAKYFEKVKCE